MFLRQNDLLLNDVGEEIFDFKYYRLLWVIRLTQGTLEKHF